MTATDVAEVAAGVQRRRHRGIIRTALTSGSARVANLAVALVTVPVAVRALGPAEFGVYVSLAAVVSLFSFLDLGVGNALIREVAEASVGGDERAYARLVSSAFYPLVAVAVAGSALAAALAWSVDLPGLLNVPASVPASGVRAAAFLAFVPTLAAIPFGLSLRVRYGLQEGARANVAQAAGFGVQLAAVAVVAVAGGGLRGFAAVLGLGPLVGYAADGVVLARSRWWARPRRTRVDGPTARRLLSSGAGFLALAVCAVVGYQTDALVVAHYLGAEATAAFGVTMQLTLLGPAFLSLFLNSLWPAYGEAAARGDVAWITRTFRRSVALALPVAALAAAGLVLLGPALIGRWAGDALVPPPGLLWAAAGYVLVNAVVGPIAVLLNGLGHVRVQVPVAVVMAVVNLGLSVVLVQRVGVAGPVLATDLAQLACVVVPTGLYSAHVLRGLGRR